MLRAKRRPCASSLRTPIPASQNVFQYCTTTARIAPSWITTLNIAHCAASYPNSSEARIRCPVEETGTNSVRPSTMPSRMAVRVRSMRSGSWRRGRPSQPSARRSNRIPTSPDAHTLLGWQVKRVVGRDVERLVPRVVVAHRAVGAEHLGAVRVGQEPLPAGRLALRRTPHLRPGEEKALIAGQAVDHRCFLAAERHAVCAISHAEPAYVSDVLAQGEAAVHTCFAFIVRTERVVLSRELVAECVELLAVGFGPPVLQRTSGVVLGALVIETMAHFVTNHRADATVIDGRIG